MKIDSAIFRLHTNATVILLVTFSIAVTTRQYVGNPIDCVHTRLVEMQFLFLRSSDKIMQTLNNVCERKLWKILPRHWENVVRWRRPQLGGKKTL